MRIAASAELTQSMAGILNSTRNPDIDGRHQIQVALAITRCVAAGGERVSLSFAHAPGLVEGLCKLKRDREPFLRVAAAAALRLLGRCDEACGINRRLLRAKWQNVLDVDQKTTKDESRQQGHAANTSQGQQGEINSHPRRLRLMHECARNTHTHLLHTRPPVRRGWVLASSSLCALAHSLAHYFVLPPEEPRRDQRLVKSASSNRSEMEAVKYGAYASYAHEDNWASSRQTAEHNQQSLHSSARSERSSHSDRNGVTHLRGLGTPSTTVFIQK